MSNVCPFPSNVIPSLSITILSLMSEVSVHVLVDELHVPTVEQSPPVTSSVMVSSANALGTISPIIATARTERIRIFTLC